MATKHLDKKLILPTFFVIGAAKSGTTTLHHLIKQHPDIFMPTPKEPHFFGSTTRYEMGLQWYSDNFYKGSDKYKVRGDASPSYLSSPDLSSQRIRQDIGSQAKLIAIFRNPVDRAYSAFWHRKRELPEDISFEEAIQLPEDDPSEPSSRISTYHLLRTGRYASNLKPFLEAFDRGNFLFLLQEDLIRDTQAVMNTVFSFLGVKPLASIIPEKRNTAAYPRFTSIQKFMYRPSGMLHRLLKPFTHTMSIRTRYLMRNLVSQVNLRPYEYPKMKSETREFLLGYFENEVKQLEHIMGRDLSHWNKRT